MTLGQAVREGRAALAAAGLDASDANYLLAALLGTSSAQLIVREQQLLSAAHIKDWQQALARRCAGEPVAYILGQRGFWTLDLYCNSHTLIPRPDTETLVEVALAHLPSDRALLGLDAGTGTGAIALALASERPHWRLLAMDYSLAALAVAQRNLTRYPLAVSLFCGSWLAAVRTQSLDFIISNPPYIDPEDPHLSQGDLRFEPRTALVAQAQGLADYQALLAQAPRVLKPGGYWLVEHGHDQKAALAQLVAASGLQLLGQFQDYGGQDRVTLAQAPE